jgi:hypothetical protein
MRAWVVTVKEGLRRLQQSCQAGQEFTMGHVAAELPPQHRNGVEPRAVGGQIQQDQPPSRGTGDRFDLIISLGIRMIPRHKDGAHGMRVDQGLPPFGDLLATCAAAAEHYGFAGMVVDGAQAILRVWLPRGGDHDVLAPRAP